MTEIQAIGKDVCIMTGKVTVLITEHEGEVSIAVPKNGRTKVAVDNQGENIVVFTRPMLRYEGEDVLDLHMVDADAIRENLPDEEADALKNLKGG